VLDRDPTYLARLALGGEEGEVEFRKSAMDRSARLHVGFVGAFGAHQVSPRGLNASHITHLVCVEGIVIRCSAVRPKVVRSVRYCPEDKEFSAREYRDATDPYGMPTGNVYPTRTEDGKVLHTEFGLSTYRDHQTVTLQEMPERAPLGQLPRTVDMIMDADLVDLVKPGDRVAVSGVYRALGGSATHAMTGRFRTVVLANHVQLLKQQATLVATAKDIENIRTLSKREDAFELIARSVAPSIYGHRFIKRALALSLLGGVERNLENGTHIRGDVNILMVGDPSTAKSQLLRFVSNTAPVAVNTTGRGSSGVGLTAAVSTDPETGDRCLVAGAMVLADRGVVCIDEFDKMTDADRVAIHEVMEQQTVTIAKAGIQASLNARCSVVAAANPVYGQYDPSISPQRNVNLPDSLLSRFDVLFIVLDTLDDKRDSDIAGHVLRLHRYQRPGAEGRPVPLDVDTLLEEEEDDEAATADGTSQVYVKYNPLLHSGALQGGDPSSVKLLSIDFLKKYIAYAKQERFRPQLTDASRERIGAAYNDLRQKADARAMPVTARTLETLIRLASAHAKVRLSSRVEERDVDEAVSILNYAFYSIETGGTGGEPPSASSRRRDDSDDSDGGDTEPRSPPSRQKRPRDSDSDDSDLDDSGAARAKTLRSSESARVGTNRKAAAPLTEAEETILAAGDEPAPPSPSGLSAADMAELGKAVSKVLRKHMGRGIPLNQLVRIIRTSDEAAPQFVVRNERINKLTMSQLRHILSDPDGAVGRAVLLDEDGTVHSVME
jgi:DNA replication licensing factor MCM3